MPAGAGTVASRQSRPPNPIDAAAARWGVPAWLLWGVFGVESDFGANLGPSSAGAEGPFQFLPSTAALYHVDTSSLASSADGAAHYLHDLHRRLGSWDAALRAYSGGGYGAQEAAQKAQTVSGDTIPVSILDYLFPKKGSPGDFFGPKGGLGGLKDLGGGIAGLLGDLPAVLGALSKLLTLALSVQFWIRAGKAFAGLTLLYMGLHALTGQGPSVGSAAKTGAELGVGAKVATAAKARW
jgi:hypothetical protein